MKLLPEKYNPAMLQDSGYVETEQILLEMKAEIESVYGQAYDEMFEKSKEFLDRYRAEDSKKRLQVQNGELDPEAYKTWRRTQMMLGRENYALMEQLAEDLKNADLIAYSVINGHIPEVYAVNSNWSMFSVSKQLNMNLAFSLIDEQTVERLLRDKPNLLPKANLNIPKDMQWNKQHLSSAITQSILQGETVDETAKRLASVTDMNMNAAVRNATTMTTSAQNGGRVDSYYRAIDMGIKLKQRWIATLDGHTRLTHRQCDGVVAEVGEEFPNGLLFPGDPNGEPSEVYNCRCVITAVVDGQNYDFKERNNRINRMGDMSYSEWKNSHGGEALFKAARNVNRDMDMHEEYMMLLGKKIPKNFTDFQKLKYNNRKLWWELVGEARKARNKRREKMNGTARI